jgi:hypothetical protein
LPGKNETNACDTRSAASQLPPVLNYERAPRAQRRPDLTSAAGACGLLAILHALMALIMAFTSFSSAAVMAGGAAVAFAAAGLLLTFIARLTKAAPISRRLFHATLLINLIALAIAGTAIAISRSLQ